MGGTYLDHSKMAYTVEEAAGLLSLSRAHLYRLIDLREIGTVRFGRSRRITSRQLEEFLRAEEARDAAPRPLGDLGR